MSSNSLGQNNTPSGQNSTFKKPAGSAGATPVPTTVASGVTIVENDDTRASFTGRTNIDNGAKIGSEKQPDSSPLLLSTPPTVSKALIRAYPYLLIANKVLGVFTWTGDDYWLSVLTTCIFAIIVLYFETVIIYFGHIVAVALISLYAVLGMTIEKEQELKPTLDDVVQCLTSVTVRSDMLLSPISSLSLSAYDLKRLFFTAIFLSPLYIIISYFLLPPRTMIIALGLFVLTYHSASSRVTRKILWKSKFVRSLCFYATGLDLDFQHQNKHSLFQLATNKANKLTKLTGNSSDGPVRFTFVLYENQRRWLGIGWTANLLSYERTPWTDEFLNEAQSTEDFELPKVNDETGMYWRWIDKTWRLDLTNDGALTLSSSKPKSTPDPKTDDGFVYFDNTWKSPSTEDTFSKYTRRRRWIRTAELVSPNHPAASPQSSATPSVLPSTFKIASAASATVKEQIQMASGTTVSETGDDVKSRSKRKSLRFDSAPPQILEHVLQKDDQTKLAMNESEIDASKKDI
ncbi:unnamed protein product [Kuraishia capsulata CBS 1993]|uniref:Peroxin/Ferlin domain-containing protein n=1 Tax=Kuraishia capsulata CBS 1993 TaxID=1382522 RepID=W6MRW2_9ASCO|nr:uncharacterized protein KUCA_T00005437001 [Kuraishia capsulata CBS 1993]CDK29449.1 unnamed protein product [Kuraishia capsulata CBS 1993]